MRLSQAKHVGGMGQNTRLSVSEALEGSFQNTLATFVMEPGKGESWYFQILRDSKEEEGQKL